MSNDDEKSERRTWRRLSLLILVAVFLNGGINVVAPHYLPPNQPVVVVQVDIPVDEDANSQFFHLTNSLATIRQHLNSSPPDPAVVDKIQYISNQLVDISEKLPHPCDEVTLHRIEATKNDWAFKKALPTKEDAGSKNGQTKKDDWKQDSNVLIEKTISNLFKKLESECEK